ncbi:hypothetical protein BASA61_009554 [Batrachochytrium salamandrivorans]|nr:hypothetical protein BASA61_009554 [Batrachochytrium salamandrivorans]
MSQSCSNAVGHFKQSTASEMADAARTSRQAAAILPGGVARVNSSRPTRLDGSSSHYSGAYKICTSSNSIDINIATSAFHVRDYLRQTGVVLSDEVARVYSNSPMQLDNNSLPEIAVGMGCTNKSVDTNEVPTNTNCVSNTMTATTAILPGGVARVNSSSPTRLDSSSLPAIVVETECVGKRMVTSRVRVRKPRGGKSMTAAASVLVDGAAGIYSDDSTRPGDTILSEIVVDTGCTGNSIERIATPESTAIVSPLLSRLKSRPLKKSRKSLPDKSVVTGALVSDVAFFLGAFGGIRACVYEASPTISLGTFPALRLVLALRLKFTAVVVAALDSATPQPVGLVRVQLRAAALCDIALDDGPTATSCLVVQEGRHRALSYSSSSHQQHSRSCSCSLCCCCSAIAGLAILATVLISATVATRQLDLAARLNNKRAAAEFTDSDTIIAAAPKRLCKS